VSQQVDSVVNAVSAGLGPAREQAMFLASLIGSGEVDPEDEPRLRAVLLGGLAAAPQISGVAFLRTDLTIIRATRTPSSFETRVTPHGNRANVRRFLLEAEHTSAPKWGDILYVPELGDTQITLIAPVRRDGRFLGAVVSVVSIANLSGALPQPQSGSVAFILSGEDRVVAHPALVGGPRGLSAQKPLLRLTELGDPVLERIWSEPDKIALERGDDDGPLMHVVEAAGEEYIFLYRQIEEYGDASWIVGAYIKSSVAMSVIDRIRWAAVATGGILIVSTLLSLLLSRAILRPVRELATAAATVSRLDLEQVAPLKGANFRELDAAMGAFNAMIGGLRLFATYVPRSLVRRLMMLQGSEGLRPEEREVTVLFTDIAGFTSMSRRLTPLRLAVFLNSHFELLGRAIDAQGGTIDKYIGDSIMAFWGAPDRQSDHALRGYRAALAIAKALAAENQRRRSKHRPPVRLRIGLHSGPAIVGNIGAPGRINYTLVGDTVNVAQRLEQLGKRYADEKAVVIIASRAHLEAAGMMQSGRPLGTQELTGRGPMEVYEIEPERRSVDEPVS
jgi:class 3 adenylate cyclase